MTNRVIIHQTARMDILEAYSQAAANAPQAAGKWLIRLEETVQTLNQNPQRCPHATENDKVAVELRELLFGKRPNVFRIVFTMDGETVRVLRFLRGQRRYLSPDQIAEALDD